MSSHEMRWLRNRDICLLCPVRFLTPEELLTIDLRRLLPDREDGEIPILSARELEVLVAICSGLVNKEVAARLRVSQYTVENHLKAIYRKLRVHNRVELRMIAEQMGLVSV